MNGYLKYGGLLFSAGLTLSLFLRLFGVGAQGIIFALAALTLFEGGTIAWSRILNTAEQGQRGIAYACLWFSAIVSVVSSALEIVLSTSLWASPIDLNFVTLIIIALSLAVNVLGVLRYEQLDPDIAEKHQELNRLARESAAQASIEDTFTTHAVMQAKSKAKAIAGDIADQVGETIKSSAVNRLTRRAGVMSFAKDSSHSKQPSLTSSLQSNDLVKASGGGRAMLYTLEEVEEMIALAVAGARVGDVPK